MYTLLLMYRTCIFSIFHDADSTSLILSIIGATMYHHYDIVIFIHMYIGAPFLVADTLWSSYKCP